MNTKDVKVVILQSLLTDLILYRTNNY